MPMPDITLRAACERALHRLAAGDTQALETIYRTLGRSIFMTAFSVLGDTHAAEDIMQDTFLRLAAHAGSYRAGGNAPAYILAVARNLALDELAKRRREQPCDELFGADAAVQDTLPLSELEALRMLSEEERQIVILKLDGGMKHREIAALLGISCAACEKRYRRALEKLKDYYKN